MKLLSYLLVFILSVMLTGQDKPDQAAGYSKRLRPGPLAEISVSIPYRQPGSKPEENKVGSRAVRVFRCEPTSGMPHLYIHEPLWSFVEQNDPPKDFPSFVRRYVPGSGPGDANLIEVDVELSSREFRELVRRTILESASERKFLDESGVRAENVQVQCMSPVQAVLELTGPGGYKLLGVCEVRTATNWGDRAELHFVLEAGAEENLAYMAAEELVVLQPTYTFIGFETGSAERTVNAERTLRLTIRQELDASQEAGTGYVTQDDFGRIERQTVATLRSELRVSHREMLTAQSLSVAAPLMELLVDENLGPQDFKGMAPEVATALAQRLVPLVKKQIESSGGDATTVTTKAKEKGTESNVQGGLSFGLGPVGIDVGGGAKWTNRDLDQLEKASGVHFEKSAETEEFVAQTAKLFTLRKGWETAELRSREVTYVTLSAGAEPRSSTPVPQTFTATAVKARAGSMVEDVLYHGVPVGTMLPFFGLTLPPGFVWADGKTNFPEDPRIAAHLRGKPVPNMNVGLLPSGPTGASGEYIGLVQGDGILSQPAQPVETQADLEIGGATLFDQLKQRHGAWFNDIAGADKSPAGKVVFNHGFVITKDARALVGTSEQKQFGVFEAPFDEVRTEMGPGGKLVKTEVPGKQWMLFSFLLDTVLLKGSRAKGSVFLTVPARGIPVTTAARPPHVVCNWIIKIK